MTLMFVRSSSFENFRRCTRRGTLGLDTKLYLERSQNETVSSRLERKYGAFAAYNGGGSSRVNLLLAVLPTITTRHSEQWISMNDGATSVEAV